MKKNCNTIPRTSTQNGNLQDLKVFFSGGSGGLCITLSLDKYGKDAVTAFYLTSGCGSRIYAEIYASIRQHEIRFASYRDQAY